MKRIATALSLSMIFAACGGGGDAEPAADEAAPADVFPWEHFTTEPAVEAEASGPTGPLTVPEWYSYDEASNTVNITLVAGQTSRNNYWNYNGAINGEIDINVPEGATVTIDLVNEDPAMAHSVGVSAELENFAAPPAPTPVFEGAITENPQSMTQEEDAQGRKQHHRGIDIPSFNKAEQAAQDLW